MAEQKRVAFLITGTQGDHQPFVPLSTALSAMNVEVEVWTIGKKMVSFLAGLGVDAKLLEGIGVEEMMTTIPEVMDAMATGDARKGLKMMLKYARPKEPAMYDSLFAHCERFKPHLIAHNNLQQGNGRLLHDMYGVNTVMLQLYPRSPTSFEPPVFMSAVPLLSQNFFCDCGVNKHLLPKMILGKMHSAALDPTGAGQRRRAAAGLPPMTADDVYELFDKMPVLCGWSPAVFGGYPDRPRDQIVGYWTLSDAEQLAAFEPTAELKVFLDPWVGSSFEKPVYFGWGSMTTRSDNVPNSSVFMTTLAVEAAMLANVRAVILSGWAKLGPEHLPADRTDLKEYATSGRVHFAGRVPHGWLMPKCQSAVVHGGAGTTAAVLKAGIPCIVAPVMPTDQPWWGQRVTALGVGVWLGKTLRNSTAAELAAAIGAVDDTMREKAARLASEINREDGPAKGADALAALAASAPPPKYPEVRRRQSFTEMGVGSQLNLTASL